MLENRVFGQAEGWHTLLNNRLLLKGITFAKMYDTSRQESFCIKIIVNFRKKILA